MKLACCAWALTGPEADVLRQIQDLGFGWIDLQPGDLRKDKDRRLATQLGLRVSCLGASFAMPVGASLDHADSRMRSGALEHVTKAIRHAATLGADTVYVIPGADDSPAALARFGNSLAELAEFASTLGIKFAVEHFPGTSLPTAKGTLAYIKGLGHPNLYLLYDSGHIQMTDENPSSVIHDAGECLAYVHFDDNDGAGDLHWALLDGVMTEETLTKTFRALEDIGYSGAISLELSPALQNPVDALARSRDIILRTMRA
ncbi:MAG: sugar phosphate isomerase/epimerase [Chloroflexi bacterium]|nr:sugar phosphate isomerase/epimerase [Chloroflexota bacterium]